MRTMQRRLGAVASAAAVVLASAAGFSCSSDSKSASDDDDDSGSFGAGRGGASVTSGGSAGSGSQAGGSGGAPGAGGTISVAGSVSSSGSSGTGGATCAGDVTNAMQVPLDIYVMLDSSGSMVESTDDGTKWEAVTNAIASFLQDPQSAGIGVGLQFFPLRDAGVPDTCTADSQCGSHGPCFQHFCQNGYPGIFACAGDQDCFTTEGDDAGPCAPLRYCWAASVRLIGAELVLCHDDLDCTGGDGDCVPWAQCSRDTRLSCNRPGLPCTGEDGEDLGVCETYDPESFCFNATSCTTSDYATPEAEIAILPDAVGDLGAAITAHEPDGDTPTAPALAGAIAHASDWARAHPDHRVIVLLATDGLPTECVANPEADESGIDEIVTIAANGVAADPSIVTYVIGVFTPDNLAMGAGTNLTDIARAGGSESAFIVDATGNVEQEFLAALDSIRGTGLACEFQIPPPTAGTTLDYSLVNVEFSNGASTESLYYYPSIDACDSVAGGWYYDVLPSAGTPTKIIACPASCAAFQTATSGSVSIRLGCQTLVK